MLDPHQSVANVVLDHSECAQVAQPRFALSQGPRS